MFILILCICVYFQTLYAQTCTITIETNLTNNTNIRHDVNLSRLKTLFDQKITNTPSVSFSESIDFAFVNHVAPKTEWTSENLYTIEYKVLQNFTEKVYHVYPIVSIDNKEISNGTPIFHVDNEKPDCSISCTPTIITHQTTDAFTAILTYNEEMSSTYP